MTAVDHNGRMRWLITFFRRVVWKLYTKSSKIMRRTVVKNVNIKSEFYFFCSSSKYERIGSRAKLSHTSMNLRKMKFIS